MTKVDEFDHLGHTVEIFYLVNQNRKTEKGVYLSSLFREAHTTMIGCVLNPAIIKVLHWLYKVKRHTWTPQTLFSRVFKVR